MIKKMAIALVVAAAVMAPAASAHRHNVVRAASCPAGVPVQTITVVNDAHVRATALATVERATTDQSLQLRAAWHTPCVRFGAGGWKLTMTSGCTLQPNGGTSCQMSGIHTGPASRHLATPVPAIAMTTGALTYKGWALAFTHEIGETLVNPTASLNVGAPPEIADPVESPSAAYLLDGVPVSDFGYPAAFIHGSAGPWDQARVLTSSVY